MENEKDDVFGYITTEINNYRTNTIPITNSKDWNMYEHIQRCKNVANAWYHQGKNDGNRPYNDIVTPILNVAFRSEGFDVKDIVPYVNDAENYYKSFLVKQFHPQWARRNQLDTFIDEVVESSVIYDLVLVKDSNSPRPEVIDLTTLAFVDQTDALAGAVCIRHQLSISELEEKRGKWDDVAIDIAIAQAKAQKLISLAGDQPAKTPSKYIELYELYGTFECEWLGETEKEEKYCPQMHIVGFYTDTTGTKQGISFYSGESAPVTDVFKQLKIDQVRSKGRACGRSILESLFEPQVWNNYAGIKIKEMLDSAINVLVTDSEELGGQKLKDLKQNTILKQEKGSNTQRLDGTLQNMQNFQNYQTQQENSARIIGSASDAQLGTNPVSGTPFSLQALVVQQGQGIHEYRQGKVATFFADTLYPWSILPHLVKEMNGGKKFSEELSFEEMEYVANAIAENKIEAKKKEMLIKGIIPKQEELDMLMAEYKEVIKKGGSRMFFESLKGELEDIPLDVFVNVKAKQKPLAEIANKLTNLIREVSQNPQVAVTFSKQFNELLESSGMSPVDFANLAKVQEQPQLAVA